jgi:O6-methylguanine-DNA--protein-cysteine methyltransferase
MAEQVAAVLAAMTEHPAAGDLPLDLRATAFQARVWQALRQIPRGQTRSYEAVGDGKNEPAKRTRAGWNGGCTGQESASGAKGISSGSVTH